MSLKSLNNLIPSTISQACQKQGILNYKIVSEWEDIVGKKLSDISTPLQTTFTPNKKHQGTLIIGVTNPGFVLEIQMMKDLILERLATYFGYTAINKISIKHISQKQINKLDKND